MEECLSQFGVRRERLATNDNAGMLPLSASPARTALPAAHFDRNAAIPVTDWMH